MTNMNGRSISIQSGKPQSHGKRLSNGLRITIIATGLAAVAACAPKPVPIPPPPPPPPPVKVIPFRPLPPGGAAFVMSIPERSPAGLRQTVNLGLSPDQTVWNFRSGWNVAALNCTDARYAAINQAYTAYVNDHQRALAQVNSRLDAVYRSQTSSSRNAIIAREAVETRTYNFFSLPPARRYLCDSALVFSNEALLTPPTDPIAFALANFPRLEAPFERFYSDYETYELESAIWDRDYGAQYGPGNSGWETVQRARLAGDPNVPPIPPVAPTLPAQQ
ncbi:MAG: hypothetical protein ABJP70_13265 [Erythrobacter sp.]